MKLFKIYSFSHYRKWIISLLRNKRFYLYAGFTLLLYFIFFANTLHESYPDEFDNILGGWYIIHGIPIYKSFFTHHGPVAYFLAGIVELFSGRSFVRFRIVYSVFLFGYTVFTYIFFRRKFGETLSWFYAAFIFIIGISATYFWGHMLLADSISGFFLAPVFGLLLFTSLTKKSLRFSDLWFISILTFLAILSSLTYLYLLMVIYLYVALLVVREVPLKTSNSKYYLKVFSIFVIPYIIFLIYLLLTRSLYDFFYQTVIFNQKYYIYNYPRAPGETHINPVRFAIIIGNNFISSFFTLLIQVKDFNFGFPFNITLAVANVSLIIYLLFKRKFILALYVFLVLIYSNGRSNPLTSKETDYQSAVYIMISLFNMCFIPYALYKEFQKEVDYGNKLIFSVLFVLVGIYSFANILFLVQKFDDKVYSKYMGTAPLIYDRPQIAPLINSLVGPNEYTWIGPFEFEELFYTNGKIASRYQIFNSAEGRSEEVKQQLIADFEVTKPKVIWFDKTFFILGENPEMYGQEFIQYLNDHYITLYTYRQDGMQFISTGNLDPRVDIEKKLYIRNESIDEVIGKLLANGYIKEEPEK